ncbi:alpha/beta hydrolase [soil metagenome]
MKKEFQSERIKLLYRITGKGDPIILLYGYTHTNYLWHPIVSALKEHYTVIIPDLRSAGASETSERCYDKKMLVQDIHALINVLGYKRVTIVGHDIGLMVAYAYAAQFPETTDRVVLMNTFLSGIGHWEDVWLMRHLWHPQSAGMRTEFKYFKTSKQHTEDFTIFSTNKLEMPFLILAGEKSASNYLIKQVKLVAKNVQKKIIPGTSHWLIEEAPQQVIPVITTFLNQS